MQEKIQSFIQQINTKFKIFNNSLKLLDWQVNEQGLVINAMWLSIEVKIKQKKTLNLTNCSEKPNSSTVDCVFKLSSKPKIFHAIITTDKDYLILN